MRKTTSVLLMLLLRLSSAAIAQDIGAATPASSQADADGDCSLVMLNCHTAAVSTGLASVTAEQSERTRMRQRLQERNLALAQEIRFAQEHPDVVVIHSQKALRDQPEARPSISKIFDDALGDHGPQPLTRSYYDRFGNRHEIVNNCWGIFC